MNMPKIKNISCVCCEATMTTHIELPDGLKGQAMLRPVCVKCGFDSGFVLEVNSFAQARYVQRYADFENPPPLHDVECDKCGSKFEHGFIHHCR